MDGAIFSALMKGEIKNWYLVIQKSNGKKIASYDFYIIIESYFIFYIPDHS
jgi:hypothetical protein